MIKVLMLIAILLAPFVGWVANIVKITGCTFDPLTAEPCIRIIGVFLAPLGAVLGFIPHW